MEIVCLASSKLARTGVSCRQRHFFSSLKTEARDMKPGFCNLTLPSPTLTSPKEEPSGGGYELASFFPSPYAFSISWYHGGLFFRASSKTSGGGITGTPLKTIGEFSGIARSLFGFSLPTVRKSSLSTWTASKRSCFNRYFILTVN